MKKCILVPDSFKGTMSSLEVSQIMKDKIVHWFPSCQVIAIPIADGGEGTVDCLLEVLRGEKVFLTTKGPFLDSAESFYGRVGDLAIIEMAASAGFHLAQNQLNPLRATTFGVGELIRHAVNHGAREIILGLGGSCTNDGGAGMAAALGTKFINNGGEEFIPTGDTLGEVAIIDNSQTKDFLKSVRVIAMCDIENPLFGETGAAYVFAPQKGATKLQVVQLDQQLRLFSSTIEKSLGVDVSHLPGGGAAGGMGAGVKAFLNGELKSGIDTVLDLVDFENLLQYCDWVFTGEGRLDSQSLSGKVVIGVGHRAKERGVPVIAVVGEREEGLEDLYHQGIIRVYETSSHRTDIEDIRAHCRKDLKDTMERILREISGL